MQASFATELRKHTLFSDCTQIELARLLAGTTQCEFAAGAEVFTAGDAASYYYYVMSGEVTLNAERDSWHRCAAETFGTEAFADNAHYLRTAKAATPLVVLRITRTALLTLAAHHPTMQATALVDLAAQMGKVTVHQRPPIKIERSIQMPMKQRIGWVATLLLPPLAYLTATHNGLAQHSAIYLALLTMTAVMWLFAVVDEFVPPLIALVAMLFINLVPAQIALAGFYSPAFILLMGVYAISAVMLSSGLVYRFMLWLLLKAPDRPFWHRCALTFFGMLLSIMVPSDSARLALMLPLYREMDNNIDAPAQSREATALMIATFMGATLFAPLLLTSKSAHLAAYTMLPTQVQLQFQGSHWLVAAAVVAVGLLATHLLAMRFLYSSGGGTQALPRDRIAVQLKLLGPMDSGEWLALCAFVVFLLGAAFPQLHLSLTAWLAGFILISLLTLGLFDRKAFLQNIDWPMLFFILSLDGLTRVIHYLGLGSLLVDAMGDKLDWIHGQLGWFILFALAITVVTRLVLPLTAGMLLAMTMLLPIGIEQGIHPWVVMFLVSLFSDIWFFPHQMSTYTQAKNSGLQARCSEAIFMRYIWWLNPLRVLLAFASIPYWNWLGLS
ncbi:MAG: cyclic nucleotide-binding domain-containing protein [Candidimonas sp.]|nr:MAG: cyclic nucleotide-binding domain-containing protein [Candidimonas sp.]TAM22615.1 MAG: cyclic nucleotide-binding domain-containing protein [Candidimonas sp.]